MAGRVGDGNGSTGRFVEVTEDLESSPDKAKDTSSPATSRSNLDDASIDSDNVRNVVDRWRSTTHSKTEADGVLRPPTRESERHPASASEVVIREKKPENLARITYEIVRRPDDLNAERVSFDVRVNGRDYEMAVRGPITEAQLQEIAKNSASTCVVLQRSGVKSFEKATLGSTGEVKVDQPQLGERGPVAEQVRSTLAAAKMQAPLHDLSFEADGGIAFHVEGRDDAFEISERYMRQAPFQVEGGELTNLAEALKTYAVLACPELAKTERPDPVRPSPSDDPTVPATTDPTNPADPSNPIEQPIVRPSDVSPSDGPGNRPNADGLHVGPSGGVVSPGHDTPTVPTDNPDVVIRPLGPTTDPEISVTDPSGRKVEDVFDYVDKPKKKKAELPGIIGGILRGTKYKPVFSADGNWFKKGLGTAGNWLLGVLGKEGTKLVHKTVSGEKKIPLTEDLTLGFTVSGRKIREDKIKDGDPRKIAIEKLRAKYPNSLPIWVEGKLGQNLAFDFGHSIPIGASGLAANFGFKADESLTMTMERLVYFQPGMELITDADDFHISP